MEKDEIMENYGRITKVGIHKDTKDGLDYVLHIRTTKMGTLYYPMNEATFMNGWTGAYGRKKQQGVMDAIYREWHTVAPAVLLDLLKHWALTPTAFHRASSIRYTANADGRFDVLWLSKRMGGWGGKRQNAGRKKEEREPKPDFEG